MEEGVSAYLVGLGVPVGLLIDPRPEGAWPRVEYGLDLIFGAPPCDQGYGGNRGGLPAAGCEAYGFGGKVVDCGV